MKKVILILAALTIAIPVTVQAHSKQRSVVVVFTGSPTGEYRMIDGVEMNCFDVDIIDPESGRRLGKGTDCLDLASIMPIGDDGGFTIDNVQFFNLKKGKIVTRVTTTIQPVGAGSPSATHITGAVPEEGTNQILDGTKRFRHAQGRVRLNGEVDMSLFGSDNIISFDCIFRIDFD
jgi:hypothetical protein